MTGIPTLRIDCDDMALAFGAKVSLDGVEVPGLRSLRLDMSVDEFNVVTLEVMVGAVDVSAEVLTQLVALVKANDEETS